MFQTLEDVIAINNKERKKNAAQKVCGCQKFEGFPVLDVDVTNLITFFFYNQNTAKKD